MEAVVSEALSHESFFFANIQQNQVDTARLVLLRFLAALVILLLPFPCYPNNVAASLLLPSLNRGPIILSGQDWPYFGQKSGP